MKDKPKPQYVTLQEMWATVCVIFVCILASLKFVITTSSALKCFIVFAICASMLGCMAYYGLKSQRLARQDDVDPSSDDSSNQ